MTRRASRGALFFLAGALAGAACATTRPPTGGATSGPAGAPAAAAAGAPPALPAPANAAESATGKSSPPAGTVPALQAREASGLTVRPLDLSSGLLAGEVESTAAPIVKREATLWAITIPIGSETPVTCFLYDKPIDGAASLLRSIRAAQKGDGAGGALTTQRLVPTEVGVIAETAYLMATLSYAKPSPQGALGGQMKMMVRPDADAPLLCLHDEVGYGATFKRITQRLARTLAVKAPGAPVEFVEIQIARLGELPIGFDRRTIVTDLHGMKVDQTTTCMLFPRGPQELAGIDRIVTERSDVAGRVVELDSVEVTGADTNSQIKVVRQDAPGHEYQISGTQAGKELAGHFKAKERDGLPSSLLVAGRLRTLLLAGKPVELKVEEYHADIAPQPLEVVYRWKGAGRAVTLAMGQLEAGGRLDERGMVEQVTLPLGGATLSQERVLMRGTP